MITSSNDSTKKLAKSFEKDLPSKINTSKDAIDSLKERFNGFKKALSLETNLTNLTKGFSGLASAASALSSLSNLTDIWSDENLSAGEKFL
jgi:predicted phage tail protein